MSYFYIVHKIWRPNTWDKRPQLPTEVPSSGDWVTRSWARMRAFSVSFYQMYLALFGYTFASAAKALSTDRLNDPFWRNARAKL